MSFNPLEQPGIAVDEQFRSWRELNVDPVDIEGGDPYTRCRIVVMNGIEVESIMFSHQFARHTDNPEVKRALALSRRAEQMQQKADNWLLPGSDGPLETTIVYEQVAVDLTAWLARMEPDPYLKQNYDFGLLEDFDHLYRYANLLDLTKGKKAEAITGTVTEIMPGRPNPDEFRHPDDDLRRHYDKHTVDPRSRLHVMTLVAAEQQTMNYYMNAGNIPVDPLARGLYLEIAMIEEQHVTQYESLLDPLETWFEQWLHHEYLEVWLYHSFMEQETDPRVKAIWELHLNMEIGQLKVAADMLRTLRRQGRRPAPAGHAAPGDDVRTEQGLRPRRPRRPGRLPRRRTRHRGPRRQAELPPSATTRRSSTPTATTAKTSSTCTPSASASDYRLQTDGEHPVDHHDMAAAGRNGRCAMTATPTTPVLIETADTGGRTMPISMVVCRPERAVTGDSSPSRCRPPTGSTCRSSPAPSPRSWPTNGPALRSTGSPPSIRRTRCSSTSTRSSAARPSSTSPSTSSSSPTSAATRTTSALPPG